MPQALKEVSHLVIIKNEKIYLLHLGGDRRYKTWDVIKNNERGKGLGKQLLTYGIENYNVNELVVNEQNPNAKAFYEHLGFKVYKRADLDEQGNHYPILYMRLENK